MAEEKKKKETEVKVEKKFCTNCGKELKDGEVCDCAKSAPTTSSVDTDAILGAVKKAWDTIINAFRKPDTTINEEMASKKNTNSLILSIVTMVCYALFLMAGIKTILASFGSMAGFTVSDYVDIPYFKVFIYGLLIYAVVAVIPMFAAFIIGKITKNPKLSFKKVFRLYAISNAPLILAYLVLAIILLINVSFLNTLGYIAFAIISMFCFFNFLLGVNKELTVREDRRSWAITALMTIWVVIQVVVLLLVCGSVVSDVQKEIGGSSYDYNDIFDF